MKKQKVNRWRFDVSCHVSCSTSLSTLQRKFKNKNKNVFDLKQSLVRFWGVSLFGIFILSCLRCFFVTLLPQKEKNGSSIFWTWYSDTSFHIRSWFFFYSWRHSSELVLTRLVQKVWSFDKKVFFNMASFFPFVMAAPDKQLSYTINLLLCYN